MFEDPSFARRVWGARTTMGVRLKYRQGSFWREEKHPTLSDAMRRASELDTAGSGRSHFTITDRDGKVLKQSHEIARS